MGLRGKVCHGRARKKGPWGGGGAGGRGGGGQNNLPEKDNIQ